MEQITPPGQPRSRSSMVNHLTELIIPPFSPYFVMESTIAKTQYIFDPSEAIAGAGLSSTPTFDWKC